MVDYKLLEEYTEKYCFVQKVKVRHININEGLIIYTFDHEYNDGIDCKNTVTLIDLINFLYKKIKENETTNTN